MFQTDQLTANLQHYFKFQSFRQGQKEIIQDVMKGYDVLGILPTGSGKSLCYQLPAQMLPGATIVISPLISLMIDQVKQLRSMNYKNVVALNSFIEFRERRQIYNHLAAYKLIYVSPELLQQDELIHYLRQINISLFVIDEAHCISQWGHEFRPDYLRLNPIIEMLNNPPVLALSATATTNVQKDIIQSLKKPQMIKHIYPMDRQNIAFCVKKVSNHQDKLSTIVALIKKYTVPTLIYFSSRKETERVTKYIRSQVTNRRVAFYHGGLEPLDRITIQQQFMNDQIDIICCTSAFGMGIDKDNIRLTIHFHLPLQLESFIQEVGRAGRDGGSSVSVLLYSRFDEELPRALIQQELPTNENLTFVFQQLNHLVRKHQTIPINIHDVMNLFQVNEIQWRYIYYQLEKNGIINNNKIYYNDKHWQQAFRAIRKNRHHRLMFKQSKLMDIINWANESNCLRKHLYKRFQSSTRPPTFQCCSNCNFSLESWTPNQRPIKQESMETWEDKLKTLLLGVPPR